jgi:hypothetical protein
VPYWYGVSDLTPYELPVLTLPASGSAGSLQQIEFRVIDRAGVPVTDAAPTARVITGAGSIVSVSPQNFLSPAVFLVEVRLDNASGVNVFEIDAGSASVQVAIDGS